MPEWLVRDGTPADARLVAVLRYRDLYPATAPDDASIDAYARALESWMTEHTTSAFCALAISGRELIGMAWLAIVDRVPTIEDHERRSGDIQSVFVLPAYRRSGVGQHLVARLLERAGEHGVSRTSLHSSSAAIPFYESLGFSSSPNLLQRKPDPD